MLTTPNLNPSESRPLMNGAERNAKQRVLIVDDHALVRAGFKQLIDSTDDLEVVGEAGTAAAALDLVMTLGCDVVLLDISLPDASVLETVALLRRRKPNLPVLIVSMHPDGRFRTQVH
jgi:two-component system invasion response regulator UvrY